MRVASALLLASLTCGCGYSVGQVAGGEGKSLSVPMFTNNSFRRDLERDLTRFVREEVRNRTNSISAAVNPETYPALRSRSNSSLFSINMAHTTPHLAVTPHA